MISYIIQIKLIFYFILYGGFVGVTFDTMKYITKEIGFLLKYVLELIYWVIIMIITYYYIINVQKGFINIYTIVFYMLGFISYYVVLSETHQNRIKLLINCYQKYLKKILLEVLFSKEIICLINNLIKKQKK